MKKNVLLLLGSLIFGFFCLEIVFRMVWQNHEWWTVSSGGRSYGYPKNKYGLRDYDYEKEKPEGTVRIVCTGDSFTWGDGVKFDDSYPKRLERTLNVLQSPHTGKKYQVLNISWTGISTYHIVERLNFIMEFNPDLIVVGYCLNDAENWKDSEAVHEMRNRYIYGKEPGKLSKFLYHKSFLISFIGSRLHSLRSNSGYIEYHKLIHNDAHKGWKRTAGSFRILSEQDVPVLFLVIPLLSFDFRHYPFLDVHKKITTELKKCRLPYIDLFPAFQHENPLRVQAIPYSNPHPSEIGHRIIEENLYRELERDYKHILGIEEKHEPSPAR